MRTFIILVIAISLSTCFKIELAEEAVISLGDDPLVNLAYRELLVSNGIEYTVDSDGYYVSEKSNLKKMEVLANQAHEELRNTSEVQLESSCVAEKVRSHLEGETFIIYRNDDAMYLKAASSVIDYYQP